MVKHKNQKGKGIINAPVASSEKENLITRKALNIPIKTRFTLRKNILLAKHFYDAGKNNKSFKLALASSLFI